MTDYKQLEFSYNKYRGAYCPLRFHIHLCETTAAFESDGKFSPQGPAAWALLLHEYFHYLQNVSCPSPITIFINWFATQTDAAKLFSAYPGTEYPDMGLISEDKKGLANSVTSFFAELSAVYKNKALLLPTTGKTEWSFFDGNMEGVRWPIKHIVVKDKTGVLVSVPLILTAFTEGYSKAIQTYIEGNGKWDDKQLLPITTDDAYYSIVLHWVRHHFPKINPLFLTLLLCDCSLSSLDPGSVFAQICDYLIRKKPSLNTTEDVCGLAGEIHRDFPSIKHDLLLTLSRLNDLDLTLSPAPPNEGAYDTRRLIVKMRTAIMARLAEPAHFLFWAMDPKDIFIRFQEIYGTPMIVVGDSKEHESMFCNNEAYERACSLQMAMAEIIENLANSKIPSVCPYFPNSCQSDKGEYCQNNPLCAPIKDGENKTIKACIMAYAARTLNASNKGVPQKNTEKGSRTTEKN